MAGARLNLKDIHNNTALHYAVDSSKKCIFKYLSEKNLLILDCRNLVEILLSFETIDVSILNLDLMAPSDLAKSKELKEVFNNHSKKQDMLKSNSQIISLPLYNSRPVITNSI